MTSSHHILPEGMRVHIPHLDEAHAAIADGLGAIEAALRAGHPASAAERAAALHDHMAAHFAEEEEMLRRHGYPKLNRHAAEHQQFLSRFRSLVDGLTAGPLTELADRALDLKALYYQSLLIQDRDYMWYFRDRAIDPMAAGRPALF